MDRAAQLEAAVGDAGDAITELQTTIATLQARLDSEPDGSDLSKQLASYLADAQVALERAKGLRGTVGEQLAELESRLETIDDTTDAANVHIGVGGEVVSSVSPFLPPPWNVIGLGVAAGLGGLADWRRRKFKRDAATASGDLSKLVFAINAAKKSKAMSEALDSQSAVIRSAMGAETASRVDALRKGNRG